MKLSEVVFSDAELALVHRLATRNGRFSGSVCAARVLPSLKDYLAGAKVTPARQHDLLTYARTGAPSHWDIDRVAMAFKDAAKAVFAARDPKKLKCFIGNLDGRREAVVSATNEVMAARALDIGMGHFKGYFQKERTGNPVVQGKPFVVFTRPINPIRRSDDPEGFSEME